MMLGQYEYLTFDDTSEGRDSEIEAMFENLRIDESVKESLLKQEAMSK